MKPPEELAKIDSGKFVDYFLNNYGGGDKDVFSDLRPRFVELLEAHVARAIRLGQVEATLRTFEKCAKIAKKNHCGAEYECCGDALHAEHEIRQEKKRAKADAIEKEGKG